VTEGVTTAHAVVDLAAKLNVDMPICDAIHRILSHDAAIDAVLTALLDRPFKDENGR
jgi:glycerol-3-phosphate dehydrogenase (NAD(P)+)